MLTKLYQIATNCNVTDDNNPAISICETIDCLDINRNNFLA